MSQAGTLATSGGGGGSLLSLTPDTPLVPVLPDFSGTIHIVGGPGIETVGTASTITINQDVPLLKTTVVVTSAQLLNLQALSPLIILAAPGANLAYQVISVCCYVPFNTTPYVFPSGSTYTMHLVQTNINNTFPNDNYFSSFTGTNQTTSITGTGLLDSSTDTILPMALMQTYGQGGPIANWVNQPIYLVKGNSDADMTGGDSDLHIQFVYRLITSPF